MVESLIDLYKKHSYLTEGNVLTEEEKHDYYTLGQYVGRDKNVKREISEDTIAWALKRLMSYMVRWHGKKVIVILDEYDTPLQEAYVYGYWNQLTSLIRSIFNSTFKTNDYLYRGLLTGITRISKESIFSDLNNLEVVTTTSEKYSTSFGFTEEEVSASLVQFNLDIGVIVRKVASTSSISIVFLWKVSFFHLLPAWLLEFCGQHMNSSNLLPCQAPRRKRS